MSLELLKNRSLEQKTKEILPFQKAKLNNASYHCHICMCPKDQWQPLENYKSDRSCEVYNLMLDYLLDFDGQLVNGEQYLNYIRFKIKSAFPDIQNVSALVKEFLAIQEDLGIIKNLSGEKTGLYLVVLEKNRIKTTSLIVAEKFGKKHKDVIKKNEKLISYIDEMNREQKLYEINRRDFSILVMGFTGEKAMEWKDRFYDAFEKMERFIFSKNFMQTDPLWQQQRHQLKETTSGAMDAVKEFIDVAIVKGQEPVKAKMTYATVNKLVYKLLFGITISPKNSLPVNFGDSLSRRNLKYLDMALDIVENVYSESLMCCIDYHTPYQAVKAKLLDLVRLIGAPFSLNDHDYVDIQSGFADQLLIERAA